MEGSCVPLPAIMGAVCVPWPFVVRRHMPIHFHDPDITRPIEGHGHETWFQIPPFGVNEDLELQVCHLRIFFNFFSYNFL